MKKGKELQAKEVLDYKPLDKLPKINCKTPNQKLLCKAIKENEIVICTGPAGTGKTHVSLLQSLHLLKKEDQFKQIILVKSVTSVKEESIGFIPGTVDEKMAPYMYSFTYLLDKIFEKKGKASKLMSDGVIEVLPLAFIRGINIENAIIAIDECITGDMVISTDYNKNAKLIRNSKNSMKSLVDLLEAGEEIKALSHNDITGELEYKKILNWKKTGVKDIVEITMQQRSVPIKTSKNHPFAIYEDGRIKYIEAQKLKIGDRLLLHKDGLNNHTIFNDNNLDLLLGFALGDGSIAKNKQSTPDIYRLVKTHGMKQLEYCKFCSEILDGSFNLKGTSGYTGGQECRCLTKSIFLNNRFINSIYNSQMKKRLTEEIEDYFTERTLALWYMDDGSARHSKTQSELQGMTFHTEGFSYEENEILQNILYNKFDISSRIASYNKRGNKYYYIYINKENSGKLQNIIKRYIHPSMDYKLGVKYRNSFDEKSYYKYNNMKNITTKLIEKIEQNKQEEVYNIEVEDNHNYFVNGILTHNCQNLSTDLFKTIISRLGDNSKMIFLGDIEQIDLKDKKTSCLKKICEIFKDNENVKIVELTDDDCVRNKKIPAILQVLRNNNL